MSRAVIRSPQALSRELARLRYEHGLTQAELADTLGLSRHYVWQLEKGTEPNLYASRLFEVLRELGAHIEVVTEGEEPDPVGGVQP